MYDKDKILKSGQGHDPDQQLDLTKYTGYLVVAVIIIWSAAFFFCG